MALTKVGKEGVVGLDNSADATAITIDSSENVNLSNTLKLKGSLDNPILFENQHSVTTDGSISTFDDSSGTMVVVGSNFYINSSGNETRFNTSEESSAIMLNRNGEVNLITGDTGATGTTKLKIDSSGHVTMPSQSAFSAKPSSVQANFSINSNVTIVFDTEIFDLGSDFASNTFTAPVTGKYQLNCTITLKNMDTAAAYYIIQLITSNREYQSIIDPDYFDSDALWFTMNHSVLADMDANDTAYISIYQSAGTAQTDLEYVNGRTAFSGYLVA